MAENIHEKNVPKRKYGKLFITKRYAQDECKITAHEPRLIEVIRSLQWLYLTDLDSLVGGKARTPIKASGNRYYHTRVDGDKRIIDEPIKREGFSDAVFHRVGKHDVNEWAETFKGNTEQLIADAKAITPNEWVVKTAKKGETQKSFKRPIPKLPAIEKNEIYELDRRALREYKYVPLMDLFKTLSNEQCELVEKDFGPFQVVKGAAGSGKTIVALHRLEKVVKETQLTLSGEKSKALFLCHNRLLADLVRQVLRNDLSPSEFMQVDIKTVYQFISPLVRSNEANYLGKERLLQAISAACGDPVRIPLKMAPEEILDEITEVILGRFIRTEREYLEVVREGMGRGLDQAARKWVWGAFGRFMAKCAKSKRYPWEWMTFQALSKKTMEISGWKSKSCKYTHLFVDEAQDLTPSVYALLRTLFDEKSTKVMLFGDSTQSIYRRGFRWNLIGYSLVGRSRILKKCYRSTTAIIYAASSLIEGQEKRFGDEDLMIPEAMIERDKELDPPKVRVRIYPDEEREYYGVCEKILDLSKNKGFPYSSTAVLVNEKVNIDKLQKLFKEFEIPVEVYLKAENKKTIDITEDSVKIISTWSAKGLEFQNLFIPRVNEKDYPSRDEDGETSDRAKRGLYTAMMRCCWNLYLSASENASGLLDLLSAQYVDREAGH